MKKVFKYTGYFLAVIMVAVTILILYVKTELPNVGEPATLTIEYTPERIARGKYLATAVNVCMDCHSTRDWSKFSGPPIPGTNGMGGDRFDQTVGMPGIFYAKNITPAGIGRYTDGELFRVITTGVSKEGHALFPLMPYPYYGKMDTEDLYSIIAYIRSIAPIKNDVPASEPDFPMNVILNTIPAKGNPQQKPDPKDVLAYGSYMTNAAGCVECHTPVDKGQIIPELAFGGGREFGFPDGSIVRSSNITPDVESGIGKWSKSAFVQRFQAYAGTAYTPPPVKTGEFNSIMPWTMYGKMTEEDLGAIYEYLKTVKPVNNTVTRFTSSVK